MTVIKMPTTADIKQAKESSRKLSKFHSADRVRLSIQANDQEPENFVLPGIVMQMLLDILSEFSKGNAIGVIPHKAELSTQQAANLLNVSRPHLVKLLEEGQIDYKKSRHSSAISVVLDACVLYPAPLRDSLMRLAMIVLVSDLLKYKEQIDDADRNKSLDALSELSQEQI